MTPVPWRLVTVDIDGTLTVGHGWEVIARALGRSSEYEATTAAFRRGELREDLHLANLLAIAEGRTVQEVLRAVKETPKLRGIEPGIRRLHERGCRVALLTHNPTYVTDWYRDAFGFDDAEGLRVLVGSDGRIAPAKDVSADKRRGLRRLVRRARASATRTVHVGDGASDAQLFPLVGSGIALNAAIPAVEAAADLALRTGSFEDVVSGLERLRPRS